MFLLILNKNPHKAVELIPDRLKFKQLLELGQLVCSLGISKVFKPVKQGKELQNFCKIYIEWIYYYFEELCIWCKENIKMQQRTKTKLSEIRADIFVHCDLYKEKHKIISKGNRVGFEMEIAPKVYDLETAIFRYVKEYAEFTEYETNSELPIDIVVNEYKKYLEWKEKQYEIRKRDTTRN